MRTISRFLIVLALLPSLLTTALALDSRYPDKEHLPVAYADMDASGFDETNLQAALTELENLCADAGEKEDRQTRKRVQALYDKILEEINGLTTQSSLIEIAYDAQAAGSNGTAAAQAAAEISEQSDRLYDRVYAVLALMADTPYQDIIDADAGEGMAAALRGYEPQTEEEAALSREETRLIQEYDQVMARTDLPEEERCRQAGEIFRQLVQIRTQMAQRAGYDDYAEYSYIVAYNRDYSVSQSQSLAKRVKQYIVPLSDRVYQDLDSRAMRALSMRGRASGEEILDAIQPFFQYLDPELNWTFAYMRKYHLYDIEASETKLPTGYTVGLPAYGTAFIFNSPYGDYQDYSDMVHEFGHFNETFHAATHDLWADFSIDVGEIHSQTLELLFTSYAGQIFGEYGDVYTSVILSNMLDSVLEGCMYNEFQTTVYQNPDMSLEDINRLFKEVSEQYGYDYEDGAEESTFWVEIPHNFSSPLYYISYATSALSSLDLWLQALDDWDAAVDTYMDLTVLSLDVPYRAAVRQVGLTDIFRRGEVQNLADRLEKRLDDGELTVSVALKRAGLMVLFSVVFGLFLLAVLLLAVVIMVRRRTARRCREFEERLRNAGIVDWPGPNDGPTLPR